MALTERLALLVDAKVDGAVRDMKSLSAAAGKTDASGKQLEVRGKAIGTAFKIGVGVVAGAALLKFGQLADEAVQSASDLSEATNKAGEVFEGATPKILAFGKTASKSIGQSNEQAISAASTFGLFFEAAGQATDQAADMSIAMVKLASDMASFNDADPSEVLVNLRSGLSGEAEPLRKFGVFLNEAAVAAKAAEMGMVGVNGKLTDGQKIQARYQLILEQTSKAQGDFARTSDGLANKQRTAAAAAEDAKAALGEGLLPAQLELTNAFVAATPAITAMAKGLGSVVKAFTSLPGPVQAVVAGTAAAGGGFVFLAPRIRAATELLGGFNTGAGKTKGALVGLGKAAGVAGAALVAFQVASSLGDKSGDPAIARWVEELEAVSGTTADDKIAAITAEISRLEDATKQSGIQNVLLGNDNAIFGIGGSEQRENLAKLKALRESLAELKHQKTMDGIASDQAGAAASRMGAKLGDATVKTQAQVDALKKARASARESGEAFVGLGDKVDDSKTSLNDWIRDMAKSAQALEQFASNARRAARRGLDDGLIKSLNEAGPAGALRMRQLANATDTEIDRANRAWRRGRQAVADYVAVRVPPKTLTVINGEANARIAETKALLASVRDRDVWIRVHRQGRGGGTPTPQTERGSVAYQGLSSAPLSSGGSGVGVGAAIGSPAVDPGLSAALNRLSTKLDRLEDAVATGAARGTKAGMAGRDQALYGTGALS